MTKLSDAQQQSVVTWNVVVDALLAQIRHHRDQVLAATVSPDTALMKAHSKAICRAAKALALFVNPSDD